MIRRLALAAPLLFAAACQQSTPADTTETDVTVVEPGEAGAEAAPPAAPPMADAGGSEAGDDAGGGDESVTGRRFASWAGRWTGVEGMVLDVTPLGEGRYRLAMQYDLDNRGTFEGREDERSIRFERNGQQLSLRRGTGEETGLKWLADERNCLIVAEGEGYCR